MTLKAFSTLIFDSPLPIDDRRLTIDDTHLCAIGVGPKYPRRIFTMANPFANRANSANQVPAPAATPEPAPAQEQPATPATGQVPPMPAKSLSDMFNNGAVSGGDKIQDLEGYAVLIRTNEIRKGMNTRNGVVDAIGADWIALEGPNQGQEFSGLIFGKVIVSSLETYFNQGQRLCVGVIGKGEAKPGKNAPWLLNPLNDEQLELAGQAVQALGWA